MSSISISYHGASVLRLRLNTKPKGVTGSSTDVDGSRIQICIFTLVMCHLPDVLKVDCLLNTDFDSAAADLR